MGNRSPPKCCAECGKVFRSPKALNSHIVEKGHYANTRTIKASRYLSTENTSAEVKA